MRNERPRMLVELRTGQTRAAVLDRRRRAVLDRLTVATESLLVSQSPSELGLATILEHSEIAKATFYKLFEDPMHLYRFVSEGLHDTLRARQLAGLDAVDANDWRAVTNHLGDASIRFYKEHPAAVRLWFAIDSPLVLRREDQDSDATFLIEFHRRFADTRWHRRLPDPETGIDVMLASFRIHDAMVALAFQQASPQLLDLYLEDAKRASGSYLEQHLEAGHEQPASAKLRPVKLYGSQ